MDALFALLTMPSANSMTVDSHPVAQQTFQEDQEILVSVWVCSIDAHNSQWILTKGRTDGELVNKILRRKYIPNRSPQM